MQPRLAASVVVSAALVASAAAFSPADAMRPVASDRGLGATKAASPLDCPTQVVGVQGDGRLLLRMMKNGDITSDELSDRPLKLDPTGMALYDIKTVKGGYTMRIRAIRRLGSPSLITIRQHDATSSFDVPDYQMFKNTSFAAGAFAGSGGYYVFTASHGKLTRWTTVRNSRGQLYYGDPVVVSKDVRGLRTLSLTVRKKINGSDRDILWGTSKGGKLQQIQVPVDHPERTKVFTVRKHGFDDVNAISLTNCNSRASTLSIIAIDGADDTAHWYTMRDQFKPRGENLIDHGLAGESANWHLHATF